MGEDFQSVWGSGTNDVWMCGRNTVVHWDGAVATRFDATNLPAPGAYLAVGGSSSDNVYVVGAFGRVLHWDGTAWTLVTTGLGSVDLNSVFVAGDEVFIGADDKLLWHYDGTTWSSFTATTTSAFDDFLVVTGTGPNRVYAFGNDRLMYRWDGSTWSDFTDAFIGSNFDILSACAVGPTVVVGGFYQSGTTNMALYDGTSWSAAAQSITEVTLWDVCTLSRDNAFAVGEGGLILQRDATGWSEVPHGLTTDDFLGAWGSGPADVYAAGGVGTVVRFDGSSWSLVNTGLGAARLYDVAGSGPGNVWILGEDALWHWDGVTWTDRWSEFPDPNESFVCIDVAPSGDVFVAGEALVHYDGTTWETLPVKVSGFGFAQEICSSSATNVWLSDYIGVVQWDGANFELRWPGTLGADLFVLAGVNNDTVLGAATGQLLQFADGNPRVFACPTGVNVNGADTGADGTTYFVGRAGLIVRVD